jgi:hypothetical protein
MAAQAGKHDVTHGRFEHSMGLGQRIIQPGAFFYFGLISCGFAQKEPGGLAAGRAHCIQFIRDPGRTANWQGSVTFDWSHGAMVTDL